jgi:hypothetical protein
VASSSGGGTSKRHRAMGRLDQAWGPDAREWERRARGGGGHTVHSEWAHSPFVQMSRAWGPSHGTPLAQVRSLGARLVPFSSQPGSHMPARLAWTRLSACRCLLFG